MALQVQLLLPDNLRSSYLRGDFVEQGKTYAVGRVHPDSSDDRNRRSLVFSFQIIDTDNREDVPLERVTSILISNDPEFSEAGTVELVEWPASPATFNPDKNYRRKLDPTYFFGESDDLYLSGYDGDGEEDGESTGFFIVENWPLSGNGGLSTVYLQAVVKAVGHDEEIAYPNGYKLYDQIIWQSERPSPPGVPEALSEHNGCTGRKTTWEFGASQEGSTGVYGGGVARYLVDFIEVRPDEESPSLISTTDDPKRSIAKTLEPEPSDAYEYTFNEFSIDGVGAIVTPSALVSIPQDAGGFSAKVCYLDQGVTVGGERPDFAVQAHVSANLVNEPDSTFTYYIGCSSGDRSTANDANQYVVGVYSAPFEIPYAFLYRVQAGAQTPATNQVFILPEYTRELLRSGGLFELYVSSRPGDARSSVQAYFTPDGSESSAWLANSLVDVIFDATTDHAVYGFAGMKSSVATTAQFSELCMARGRFVLGADAGDCSEGPVEINFPSAHLGEGGRPFSQALGSDWTAIVEAEGDRFPEYDVISTGSGEVLQLYAPVTTDDRAATEFQCKIPTFSERAFVDVDVAHHAGDFYVTFSPTPYDGTRCAVSRVKNESSELGTPPTMAVVFSTALGGVYVLQRLTGGGMSGRKIAPYEPNSPRGFDVQTPQIWSLQISSVAPDGRVDGTWLVARRNGEFYGRQRLDHRLPSERMGLGYYVAFGVRGGMFSDVDNWDEDNDDTSGLATVYDFRVSPEPPAVSLDGTTGAGRRRVSKKTSSYLDAKPFLGQFVTSSLTDLGGFELKTPTRGGDDFAPVRLLASGNVDIGAAPDSVDSVGLRAGDRLLLRGQLNPAENGIYEVVDVGTGSDGVWARAEDLSESQQATYGSRCLVERTVEARYIAEVNIPTSTTADSNVLDQAPTSVGGLELQVGNRVLCNAQSNPARNGLYVVEVLGTGANGRWRRAPEMNDSQEILPGTLVRVNKHATLAGRIFELDTVTSPEINTSAVAFTVLPSGAASYAGTTWWADQNEASFILGENSLPWKSADFVQVLKSYHATGIHPSQLLALLEVMVRPRDNGYTPDDFPRARLYQRISDDEFGPAMTPWLEPAYVTGGSLEGPPVITPHNYLCQYELWQHDVSFTDDAEYWLLLALPANCEAATANAPRYGEEEAREADTMSGVNRTWSLWHKVFLRRNIRRNNAFEGAVIQTRLSAASHARWLSESSTLSDEVLVDKSPPAFGDLGRPLVTPAQAPTVRTVTLDIEAEDSASGVMAFRVIKEGDLGTVVYGAWQSWREFLVYHDLTAARVATDMGASPVTMSGVPASIDGVTNLLTDDRVLVFNSPTPSQNGVYVIGTGDWTRATELDEDEEIVSNLRIAVAEGDNYGGVPFYISLGEPNDTPPYYQIDVDDFNFVTDQAQAKVARYTLYLHDSWPLMADGTPDTSWLNQQNQGYDGQRRLWVQLADFAGNISESDPVTVTAQGIAVVDTTPPSGTATLTRKSDGAEIAYTNLADNALARLQTYDRVTAVREVRTRLSQAGIGEPWTRWTPAQEYLGVSIGRNVPDDSEIADGVKRLEAQFRDYGNNASQPEALWNFIDEEGAGYIFFALKPWSPPDEGVEWLYMAGVKAEDFEDYGIIDAEDPFYPAGKAYFAVKPGGSGSRVVYARDGDDISLTVSGVEWTRFTPFVTSGDLCTGAPPNSYRVDSERGVIVFCTTPTSGSEVVVTIRRKSGVLRRWNGARNEHVFDLGGYGEKGILSLASAGTLLVAGGYSGNIWYFDGATFLPAGYSAQEDGVGLPVTCLATHKFHHETTSYLYAGTSKKPRLYRAPIEDGGGLGDWEVAGAGASYFQATAGDITCGASLESRLFLGTTDDRIVEYRRISSFGEEQESVTYHLISSLNIGNNEPASMPVSSMTRVQNQVLFSVSNKPEVWSIAVDQSTVPDSEEQWAVTEFDRWFVNRCAPAQFYVSGGNATGLEFDDGGTESRENGLYTSWVAVTDPNNESGQREFTVIQAPATKAVFYSLGDGTDWQQISSSGAPYTLEFTTQYVDGERQSIDVADGRYVYRLDLGASDVVVSSGDRVVTVGYQGSISEVESLSTRGATYPERGLRKLWSFAQSPSVEDTGPYFIGDRDGKDDVFKWKAGRFVVPSGDLKLAGEVMEEEESESASFSATTRFLRVEALDGGLASILWSDGDILVDGRTSVFVRMRLPLAAQSRRGADAKVRVAWSSATGVTADDLMNFDELPAAGDDAFHTYQFKPAWDGVARTMAIQVAGVELMDDDGLVAMSGGGDYFFDIDYIAVASDSANSNIADAPTGVRIGVNGQSLKLWVGASEFPIYESTLFLTRATERAEIRFGKLDPDGGAATFLWQRVRAYIGEWLPPVTTTTRATAISWRFPSAGGARVLTPYQGTAWCLLDGVNKMARQDSPDDRAMKAFSFVPELQAWRKEAGDIPRISGGDGITRPFAASGYRNSLVVCGQQASISYTAVQTGSDAVDATEEPDEDQYDTLPFAATWQVSEVDRDFPLPRPTV